MRKSNAEFTEEVFLRSENRIKQRKAIKRTVISMIPLVACVALVVLWQNGLIAPVLPEINNPNTENEDTDSTMSNGISVQVEKGGKVYFYSDEQEDLLVAMLKTFTDETMKETGANKGDMMMNETASDDADLELELEGSDGSYSNGSNESSKGGGYYLISLKDEDGKVTSYKVLEHSIKALDSGENFFIKEEEMQGLLELLGVERDANSQSLLEQ